MRFELRIKINIRVRGLGLGSDFGDHSTAIFIGSSSLSRSGFSSDSGGRNSLGDGGGLESINSRMQVGGGIGTLNKNSIVDSDDGVLFQLNINNDGVLNDVDGQVQDFAGVDNISTGVLVGLGLNHSGGGKPKRGCSCHKAKETHDSRS